MSKKECFFCKTAITDVTDLTGASILTKSVKSVKSGKSWKWCLQIVNRFSCLILMKSVIYVET